MSATIPYLEKSSIEIIEKYEILEEKLSKTIESNMIVYKLRTAEIEKDV